MPQNPDPTVGRASGSAICPLPEDQLFPGLAGESGMRRSETECGLFFPLRSLKLIHRFTDEQSCHRLSSMQVMTDLNPPCSKRLTFSSYLYSHLKKEKNPTPSALPPCVLPPSHALPPSLLPHSIPERQTEPDTSAARSTDSFLSTPALSGCSAGVFEILARCRGPVGDIHHQHRGESLGPLGGPVVCGLG